MRCIEHALSHVVALVGFLALQQMIGEPGAISLDKSLRIQNKIVYSWTKLFKELPELEDHMGPVVRAFYSLLSIINDVIIIRHLESQKVLFVFCL